MKITERHIKFAKLLLEGQLKAPEIAVQCGISERQGRNWKKHPETKRLIDAFAEAAMRDAKRLLARYAKRAAQALVLLLETRAIQEGEKTRYEFVHPPEVVRKAARDICEWAGVGVKGKEQGSVTIKVVQETIPNSAIISQQFKEFLYKMLCQLCFHCSENKKPQRPPSDIEKRALKIAGRARNIEKRAVANQERNSGTSNLEVQPAL